MTCLVLSDETGIVAASLNDLEFLLPIPDDCALAAKSVPVTLGTNPDHYTDDAFLAGLTGQELSVCAVHKASTAALREAACGALLRLGWARDLEGRWLEPGWESVPAVATRRP